MRKLLAAVLVLGPIAASEAATITYSNEATFLTQIQSGYYLEDFSTYTYGSPLNGNSTPSASYSGGAGFSYTASAFNGLWSNVSSLSTNFADVYLTINFTGSPVTAVGGIVTATDSGGMTLTNGKIDLKLNDGTLTTITTSEFAGFVSDTPISSITFTPVQPNPLNPTNWTQLDHFYVGAAVPEPGTLAVSLGASWLLSRRRQRAC